MSGRLVAPSAAVAALLAAVATVAAYRAGPAVPLLAFAGLAAAGVAATRPLLVALAGVAAIPADSLGLALGSAGLSPAEALFALAGIGWLVRCAVERRWPAPGTRLDHPALLLLLAIVPGLLLVDDRAVVGRVLMMWTLFAAVGALVAARGDVRTVRWVLGLLAAAGAVSAAVAIVQGGGQLGELQGDIATGRAAGAFSDPNVFAGLLALALPGALVLAAEKRGAAPARAMSLLAATLVVAGLAMTLSRGGMLAATAGAGVLLLLPRIRVVALGSALVLAALVVFGANPTAGVRQVDTVFERVVSIRSASESATDQRAALYRVTPQIFGDHPLAGVGANHFSEIAPRYGLIDPTTGFTFDHPHNVLLTIAVELGVLGLLALLWLTVALARTLWRACRGPERALAVAVTAALATVAVQGAVDFTLRSNVLAATVAVLAGCAAVLNRTPPGTEPRSARP